MNINYPRETVILDASDMCKHRYHGPNDTHCLIGWGMQCSRNNTSCEFEIRSSLNKVIKLVSPFTIAVDKFNDRNSLETNARVWNTAMRNMGYEVPLRKCLKGTK